MPNRKSSALLVVSIVLRSVYRQQNYQHYNILIIVTSFVWFLAIENKIFFLSQQSSSPNHLPIGSTGWKCPVWTDFSKQGNPTYSFFVFYTRYECLWKRWMFCDALILSCNSTGTVFLDAFKQKTDFGTEGRICLKNGAVSDDLTWLYHRKHIVTLHRDATDWLSGSPVR